MMITKSSWSEEVKNQMSILISTQSVENNAEFNTLMINGSYWMVTCIEIVLMVLG